MAMRILLAEENLQFAAEISGHLKQQGFDVQHESDGIAALRAIAAEPPDLLLIELKLPACTELSWLKSCAKVRAPTNSPSL